MILHSQLSLQKQPKSRCSWQRSFCYYFFFNKDSLKRIVECVLNHLILPPLCQILFIRLEVSHYVDNGLGAPHTLQDEEADISSESLQHGLSVVPFTC